MNVISSIAKNFANLIYPAHCAICRKSISASNDRGICAFCFNRIRPNPKPCCAICGHTMHSGGRLCADCSRKRPSFTMARSACIYEGSAKELIHLYKYKKMKSLAVPLALLLIDLFKNEAGFASGIDAVTFVPLHGSRLRERDFNQSMLLARRISAELSIPLVEGLVKIRRTANQNELSRKARLQNLNGAFQIRKGASAFIRAARLLLVDDVMTTGATFNECSRVLVEAGAREVKCVAVARGA